MFRDKRRRWQHLLSSVTDAFLSAKKRWLKFANEPKNKRLLTLYTAAVSVRTAHKTTSKETKQSSFIAQIRHSWNSCCHKLAVSLVVIIVLYLFRKPVRNLFFPKEGKIHIYETAAIYLFAVLCKVQKGNVHYSSMLLKEIESNDNAIVILCKKEKKKNICIYLLVECWIFRTKQS